MMQFRAYDFLTQLIPGILFVGIVFLFSNININLTGNGTVTIAILTVICFIIGYIINAIGHIIESLFIKEFNNKITTFKEYNYVSGSYLIFKPFSKLTHINGQKPDSIIDQNFIDYLDKINKSDYQKLEWLNQDIKFARSLIVTSFLLLIFCITFGCICTLEIEEVLLYIFTSILLIISIYRFIQSSIDYVILVIKLSEKSENVNKQKTN